MVSYTGEISSTSLLIVVSIVLVRRKHTKTEEGGGGQVRYNSTRGGDLAEWREGGGGEGQLHPSCT